MRSWLAALLLVTALGAEAKSSKSQKKKAPPDPRTSGLGNTCESNSGCKSKKQRCLKMQDANGKPEKVGFCVLPCLAIEAGITQVVEGKPLEPASTKDEARKKAPPRCPPKYACHGADNSTPIDICVKE